jgi:hypothetical protein
MDLTSAQRRVAFIVIVLALAGLGAFQLWRDVREFEKVSVDPETATVTWEGGIRLDADILYHDVKANQIQHAGAGEPSPAVG